MKNSNNNADENIKPDDNLEQNASAKEPTNLDQNSKEPTNIQDIKKSIEAILIAVSGEQTSKALSQFFDISEDELLDAIEELNEKYLSDNTGFQIRDVKVKNELAYVFASVGDQYDIVKDYINKSDTKLSHPALETLSIIAYRGPISRSEIAQIRGVNVNGVVKTLLARDLIEPANIDQIEDDLVVETDPENNGEAHEISEDEKLNLGAKYIVTDKFLDMLGLDSIEDLPPIAPYIPEYSEL
ncbi:MAG: SMC-Scp complex subunit ScpB [Bifidobacteriaceae bacterium]|jgi:segregation and condensation protein B|nr:SMC-Scp complex subunit ScpB [Bifidobacteriaceae bacterium]